MIQAYICIMFSSFNNQVIRTATMTAPGALPGGTHTDHRVELEAVYWGLSGLSTIFIALRVWHRVSRRMLGVDDWLMVACWSSFIASGVLLTVIAETGGTRHKSTLTAPELQLQAKLQTATLTVWTTTALLGKMAIGFAILRLLRGTTKWHTWPVHIVIYLTVLTSALEILLTLFRCGNPRNLWDLHDGGQPAPQHACLKEGAVSGFRHFAAAWHVFVCFFLACFPMWIIWALRITSPRRKHTIMTLLGLPAITGLAALAKVAVARATGLGQGAAPERDSTWDIYAPAACTAAEAMLLIVCGSVPVMVPVWDNLVRSCRQGYGSASGMGGELPQARQGVEDAGRREGSDLEESRLVGRCCEGIAELPSVVHARESLRCSLASERGVGGGLPTRWYRGEKRWGGVEVEGFSEGHCSDAESVVLYT
ncbi:hypothetical protein KVR01_012198 [Diaporthe batatas]|uniref:uncharacterized protein n=1 Tax=Diaporthe batatas TaxID=748121 RepID=UPI001D0563E1|nr:uncharacterized protein KVR01_012198 [Diaporthe batatas]KAG8157926.1 hypothetical protein KVR01_012198 [Diaporthe batatas]